MLAQKAAELVLELVKSTHSRLVSDVRSTEDTETPAGDNLSMCCTSSAKSMV